MKNVGIYIIENQENGKIYVGASTDLHKRWSAHKTMFRKGTHQSNMQADWDKYGWQVFKFSVVEKCPVEYLNEREKWWGEEYKSVDPDILYNINPLGCSNYSEERSNKLSEAKMGNQFAFGRKNENSSSKYYGVFWHIRDNKWQVSFKVNGEMKYFGSFENEVDAAKQYNKMVLELGLSNPLNNI